jgi:hypothetical protein
MKIRAVLNHPRRQAFEVRTSRGAFAFPYDRCRPTPRPGDTVKTISIDADTGRETFTYTLESGKTGVVHVEKVLDHNEEPAYMHEALLYRLTLAAVAKLAASPLSKREVVRRLGTSPSQLYRLLDPTNTRKSVDRMLGLLRVLGCEVDIVIRPRAA